jgi:hypothetical protein
MSYAPGGRVLWLRHVAPGLLVVLVLCLVNAGAAFAAFYGSNGRIAFSTDRDGNREIYTIQPNGSGLTRLTNDPASDTDPAWSPNGAQVAFASDRDGSTDLYVMNADGSGVTQVTHDGSSIYNAGPSWSPDGTKLVFARSDGGYCDTPDEGIFTVNVDGTGESRLVCQYRDEHDAVWSPDGSKIAFSDGNPGGSQIWTVNIDGSGLTDLSGTGTGTYDFHLDWAPDAQRIAFDRNTGGGGSDAYTQVYTMKFDGTEQTKLTNDTSSATYPVISPDNGNIAFTRGGRLYVVDSQTGWGANPVTPALGDVSGLDWQALPSVPHPKGAAILRVALVPAFAQCTAPNTTHGPPLAAPACHPPVASSIVATVGTADSNGAPTKGRGDVILRTEQGDPATPEDEADVQVELLFKDVRNKVGLADYSGDLHFIIPVGETVGTDSGAFTTVGVPLDIPVGCTPTVDATEGSTCSLSTTFDSIVPNAITEGARTQIEIGQIAVLDSGGGTFAKQGIFIP